jgi:hypothetical protein
MTLADFNATLCATAPPSGLSPSLAALWWAWKGDWERSHGIVQEEEGVEAAWVHACLHRVEGDPGNAGYWYRRAGKPPAAGSFETEWKQIASAFLQGERA